MKDQTTFKLFSNKAVQSIKYRCLALNLHLPVDTIHKRQKFSFFRQFFAKIIKHPESRKPLRKIWKILRNTLLILILLLVSGWVLIQLPPVQNWLVSQVTSRLSKDLNTTVTIRSVNFSLFNKMLLNDALILDMNCDTLLYAGTVKVNITDWWFFKDHAQLQYIGLEDAIHPHPAPDQLGLELQVPRSTIFRVPPAAPAVKDTTHGIQLDLKEIDLSRIHLQKHDAWRGEDMDLQLRAMALIADTISFSDKVARIRTLTFTQPYFTLTNYKGLRPTAPG